ncbi:hypothetical protein [Eubacterium ramulus]|uniref:hypothetical protein n=1 Tax=Eubacterium ramulus TaxID=39490 RepID=UPI0035A3D3B2
MEKNILKQYDSVLKEITETDRRILKTQAKIERMEKDGTVTDSVSGGYGGTQHFKIEGLPTTEYNRQKSLLLARKLKLENLRKKLQNMTEAVETYIFSMKDSECRRIAAFRYIDKLSWKKVAEQMGSGHTEDSCRKTLERYMKKY